MAPGIQREAGVRVGGAGFDALSVTAAESAAHVVSGEAALQNRDSTEIVALMKIDSAALVVLGEGAGFLFKDL